MSDYRVIDWYGTHFGWVRRTSQAIQDIFQPCSDVLVTFMAQERAMWHKMAQQ